MPEAAVHEDDLPSTREHQVRLSRKRPYMELVSVTKPVEKAAHGKFGSCIFGPNSGHALATLFLREGVHLGLRDWQLIEESRVELQRKSESRSQSRRVQSLAQHHRFRRSALFPPKQGS